MNKVYLIEAEYEDEIIHKIGFTRNEPLKRVKQLSTGSYSKLSIIKVFESDYALKIEKYLHKKFLNKRIKNEWFKLSYDDILEFEKLCTAYEINYMYLLKNNYYIS